MERMKMGRLMSLGCVLMMLALAGTQATATPVTFGFTGTVTEVTDPSGVLAGYVWPQASFAGEFTFNTDAQDLDLSDDSGRYEGDDFLLAMQLGALAFDSSVGFERLNVHATAWIPSNGFTLSAWWFDVGQFYVQELGIYLSDPNYQVFTEDSLPVAPPPLEVFRERRLEIIGTNGVSIRGTVESLYLVPEPTSCLLLGLFSFGFLIRRGRSR